jgi:hypothetical protein
VPRAVAWTPRAAAAAIAGAPKHSIVKADEILDSLGRRGTRNINTGGAGGAGKIQQERLEVKMSDRVLCRKKTTKEYNARWRRRLERRITTISTCSDSATNICSSISNATTTSTTTSTTTVGIYSSQSQSMRLSSSCFFAITLLVTVRGSNHYGQSDCRTRGGARRYCVRHAKWFYWQTRSLVGSQNPPPRASHKDGARDVQPNDESRAVCRTDDQAQVKVTWSTCSETAGGMRRWDFSVVRRPGGVWAFQVNAEDVTANVSFSDVDRIDVFGYRKSANHIFDVLLRILNEMQEREARSENQPVVSYYARPFFNKQVLVHNS